MLVRFFSLFLLLLTAGICSAQPLPDRYPVSGVIIDSAGKPLSGVLVSIRRQDDNGPYAFWSGTAVSNEKGQFRFVPAETGRYYLNAELAGFAPIYNKVISWKSGSAPLKISFTRLASVQIKVLKTDGAPLTGAPVWVRLRGDGSAGQNSTRATTNGNGEFRIDGLLPATYSLYVGTTQGYGIAKDLALKSDLVQSLKLQKGGTFRASVRDNSTAPKAVGGALLTLIPADTDEAVRFAGIAVDPNEDYAFLAAMGEKALLVSADGNGAIQISNLPPGRYATKITANGYDAPASGEVTIEADSTKVAEWNLVPRATPKTTLSLDLKEPGGQTASGEMAIRMFPLDINGMVTGEDFSEDNPLGTSAGRRASTDANGRVVLYPMTPGYYRVFANHFRPGLEGTFESASVDVKVPAEGATASLVLKATP